MEVHQALCQGVLPCLRLRQQKRYLGHRPAQQGFSCPTRLQACGSYQCGSVLSLFTEGPVRTFLCHTSFTNTFFSVGNICNPPLPCEGKRAVSVVCGKPFWPKAAGPHQLWPFRDARLFQPLSLWPSALSSHVTNKVEGLRHRGHRFPGDINSHSLCVVVCIGLLLRIHGVMEDLSHRPFFVTKITSLLLFFF